MPLEPVENPDHKDSVVPQELKVHLEFVEPLDYLVLMVLQEPREAQDLEDRLDVL